MSGKVRDGGPFTTNLCMSLDLSGDKVSEDLRDLCQVDVNELSLQVQTEERKEVPFLNLNQLIVPLERGEEAEDEEEEEEEGVEEGVEEG